MPNPLTYQRFSDDVFMLLCRAETPVAQMPDHPVIAELAEQLDDVRSLDGWTMGQPFGVITKPRAWRGFYNINGVQFTIPSLYAFPKFYGLMCDTITGHHDAAVIEAFVSEVNAAVAADLGVERLG